MDQENTSSNWRHHDLFRGIILFGFALLLFQLIISGAIKYYIAPKMVVFSVIAMCIMLLLSVMHILRSCSNRETNDIDCGCGVDHQAANRPWLKIVFYGIFILPILTGFSFPQKFLDSAVAENRGVQLNFNTASSVKTENASSTQGTKAPEKSVDATSPDQVSSVKQEKNKSPEEVFKEARFGQGEADAALALYKQPIIHIPDNTYVENLSTINIYLDQFIGKKMEFMGFVYRDPTMKKDETVVARFAVSCCTADATVFGLDVQGNVVNSLSKDTWVKVQGTLDQMELNGEMVPMLHVDKIEKVKAPKDPYVY